MSEPNSEMAQQVAMAACDFEQQRTGHVPKSVTVVLNNDTLVITLRGVLSPLEMDLAEAIQFVQLCSQLGVKIMNISAGSPYYNPHIQRPAIFPPSDGYLPPEDPLVGVARASRGLERALKEVESGVPESLRQMIEKQVERLSQEERGVLDAATGARFRDEVLAVGGSRPALESFRAFRGRGPQVEALLRHSGMITAPSA